ncbi:VOC family protein [Cellulomonas oligotrophica]|uniref:Putative enzyme related to lactoylglutathione lyase n=1 Tax=Cellulomonas oligotrophica TaxID=931536 RepID=A0A7Y9FH59_9CELL|nr:VOC family protein [Cellulomonas oligotrophica]NYD87073.1 putative enzyme related to lactoylglutathione lyase [Cellulomonas oligotrophica]GIG32141.1 hypothetical protein Col01nite_13000 [Cellulomonas oligotrophica]
MLGSVPAFSSFSVDDLDAAQAFYADVLGVVVERTPMGLWLRPAGGAAVFVYPKGPEHAPASFTVLSFSVPDVTRAAAALVERGVELARYPGAAHDEDGVVRDPRGPHIAWFTDPAGNVLAVLEERTAPA